MESVLTLCRAPAPDVSKARRRRSGDEEKPGSGHVAACGERSRGSREEGIDMKSMSKILGVLLLASVMLSGCVVLPVGGGYDRGGYGRGGYGRGGYDHYPRYGPPSHRGW
jgi:hypothetical protein